MNLTKQIQKKYGSVRKFCDRFDVSYSSFRGNLLARKIIYPKAVNALLESKIINDEKELMELLK